MCVRGPSAKKSAKYFCNIFSIDGQRASRHFLVQGDSVTETTEDQDIRVPVDFGSRRKPTPLSDGVVPDLSLGEYESVLPGVPLYSNKLYKSIFFSWRKTEC